MHEDIDPVERSAFDRHLTVCAGMPPRARTSWGSFASGSKRDATRARVSHGCSGGDGRSARACADSPGTRPAPPAKRFDLPVWAQVAAAMLFVGLAAGLANLRVTYNAARTDRHDRMDGTAPPPVERHRADRPRRIQPRGRPTSPLSSNSCRGEMGRATAQTVTNRSDDAATIRRLRTLIDDSEKRQQRELSLRVAEISNDLHAQRAMDLQQHEPQPDGNPDHDRRGYDAALSHAKRSGGAGGTGQIVNAEIKNQELRIKKKRSEIGYEQTGDTDGWRGD